MSIENETSQYFRQSLQQSVSNKFGDFQVGQQLKHGGFGHVFKLIQRKTKRIFALKVLDKNISGQQEKIKNQINIHQSLKNRYILQMNNKFHDQYNYYMVLQYCQKGDLLTYMNNKQLKFGMPIEQVKDISEQIAKGLSYLHKQNIIHCDIKPSNILINQKDQIKICDFGLSSKIKNKQKVKGPKGTLNHLAPQCMFYYDQKIDVWALGVLIYFITTGTVPFQISDYKQFTTYFTEQKLNQLQYPDKIPLKLKDLLKKIFVLKPLKRFSINQVLNHPFITGQQLIINEEEVQSLQPIRRIRSHASSTIECMKKSESLKMTLQTNQQMAKYNTRRSRPNSQNREYDSKQIKQNYMERILQKKTKMMQKYSDFDNKQNNINCENIKKNDKNQQNMFKMQKNESKTCKVQKVEQKIKQKLLKKSILPLNTQGIIIKPIVQKNCITKIDSQGICRIRQQCNEENKLVLKQIKISPDGTVILMKLNKEQKFYTINNLPQKYHKQYQNCKKIVNSAKNHTPKLDFIKKINTPIYKEIHITIMYSGKVIATINQNKIQTTQIELQQDCVTFAQNGQKFITKQQSLKHQIKCLYQKLINI